MVVSKRNKFTLTAKMVDHVEVRMLCIAMLIVKRKPEVPPKMYIGEKWNSKNNVSDDHVVSIEVK